MMKKFAILTTLLLVSPCLLRGQGVDNSAKPAAGFVFAAPGAFVGDGREFLHFGGGGEGLLKGGFGATAELGYLARPDALDGGIGLFSAGALYQFGPKRKTVPFVTGGYSMAFRSGSANLMHVGGGLVRWVGSHWGLRIEGRDHFRPQTSDFHTLEIRVGVQIR